MKYLTEDNASCYAAATLSGGNLKATQGSRPNGRSYNARTVLLLPERYAGDVSVYSGGGSVSLYHIASDAAYDLFMLQDRSG